MMDDPLSEQGGAELSGLHILVTEDEYLIADALVLVGQHGIYCQSARQVGKPAMDIQLIQKSLVNAKELIASLLEAKKPA